MNMDDKLPEAAAGVNAETSAVFVRLGKMTRELHEALNQLGVMPQLQHAAEGLPDARGRLHYVAEKTAMAADRVLDAVDEAKVLHARISDSARALSDRLTTQDAQPPSTDDILEALRDIEATAGQADAHLTDIMLAQDFHDLTGQVVARVVTLAQDLEMSLVKLVVDSAPEEKRVQAPGPHLSGPVIDPKGRDDVAVDQAQVDDLLASLGF